MVTSAQVQAAKTAVHDFVHNGRSFKSLYAGLRPIVQGKSAVDLTQIMHMFDPGPVEWPDTRGKGLYMELQDLLDSKQAMDILPLIMVFACFVAYDDDRLFVHVIVQAASLNARNKAVSTDEFLKWETEKGIMGIIHHTKMQLKAAAALPPDPASAKARELIMKMPTGDGELVLEPKPNADFRSADPSRAGRNPKHTDPPAGRPPPQPTSTPNTTPTPPSDGSAMIIVILVAIVGIGLVLR
jgi:hypothetical protein